MALFDCSVLGGRHVSKQDINGVANAVSYGFSVLQSLTANQNPAQTQQCVK